MKKILIILTFVFIVDFSSAQTVIDPCGNVGLLNNLESQYPGFKAHYDAAYLQQVHKKVVQNRKIAIHDTFYTYDTIYTIPIVFHVLYHVAAQNLNDSLMVNQIEVLNNCYRRLNKDTIKTRSFFKSRAGDVRIQFEFAKTDPLGAATTGIIHKYTNNTYFEGNNTPDLMKYSSSGGDDAWDPGKYLNIWVCDIRQNGSEGLLGYAFPPYGHPNWPSNNWVADSRQGVVLFYKSVGRNNPLSTTGILSNTNEGKVAVHEIGHYFGLRHISGDPQSASQQCVADDYLFDTPRQRGQTQFNCPIGTNSCTEPNDLPDMIENYMDYSSHPCQNMFTKEQVGIMRATIENFRVNLPIKTEIVTKMHFFDTVVYNELKMYVTDKQRVYFELKNEDILNQLKVDAYDLSGRIMVKDIGLSKNENYMSTANFAPGIYVFVLKDRNNKVIRTEKLFITKN